MSNSIIYAVAELKEQGSFNLPDLARELLAEHRVYVEQDHGHGCFDLSGNMLDELYENAVNEELGGGSFSTTHYNITFETP